jgi:hypothetical protein
VDRERDLYGGLVVDHSPVLDVGRAVVYPDVVDLVDALVGLYDGLLCGGVPELLGGAQDLDDRDCGRTRGSTRDGTVVIDRRSGATAR